MGKFVIRETKTGMKFDLKAGNGEVIATSEVYTSEKSCRNGIVSVTFRRLISCVEVTSTSRLPLLSAINASHVWCP